MKTSKIKPKLTAIAVFFSAISAIAQAGYGEIRGIVKNKENETVPFATIKILQGNVFIGGTQTDMDGAYKYKPLTPGTYEMVIMEAGHQTQPINKVKVNPDQTTYVDPVLATNTLGTVTVVAKEIDYSRSAVDKNMYSMVSIDSRELLQSASATRGDIKGMLPAISSNVVEEGGQMHVRGSRGDATAYFVDGVRTLGATTVPGLAVENLTFFSGGVPAMYGDLTSGAVIVTTKSYFSGLREKNIRQQEYREKQEAKKQAQKEKEETEKRKKEIEQQG